MTALFNLPMERLGFTWDGARSVAGAARQDSHGADMRNIGGTLMMKTSSDTYYQAGKLGSVRHRPDNPEAVRLHSLELNLNAARGK